MTATTFIVDGMTCQHCVASVSEEVADVAGVERAEVDLASGRLTVTGSADPAAVRAAVVAAGYTVVQP